MEVMWNAKIGDRTLWGSPKSPYGLAVCYTREWNLYTPVRFS